MTALILIIFVCVGTVAIDNSQPPVPKTLELSDPEIPLEEIIQELDKFDNK